ncbi:MAG: flagella basal body P-ring formation protein FlgA [Polyangiaceae bacterium]|nr:flagella basal body P-ring formation protein FlgA [Polyangiaceae bacterium]
MHALLLPRLPTPRPAPRARTRLARAALFVSLFAAPSASGAGAPAEVVVDSARLELGAILPGVEPELAAIDLGPAPGAGQARVVTRGEVATKVREQAPEARVPEVPARTRVVGASRRVARDELARWIAAAAGPALPRGVSLEAVEVERSVVVSPRATVDALPRIRIVKREGAARVSVVAALVRDGAVVARIPASLRVRVSEEATRPLVPQGTSVRVEVAKGGLRVSAAGVALVDLDDGEVGTFRVSRTGRVVRARLTSADTALVVER